MTVRCWSIGPLLALAMIAAAGMAAAASHPAPAPTWLSSDTDLGELRVFKPETAPKELVFLFSDLPGWDGDLDRAATAMARDGAAVLGVDLPAYLANLKGNRDEDCHYLDSAIERTSKRLEKDIGIRNYRWPILAGIGSGGTLAYGAAAQAPDATIAGALAVDPAATLATRLPLCSGAPYKTAQEGGYSYDANPDIPGWLAVAERHQHSAMPWLNEIPTAERVSARNGDDPAMLLAGMVKDKIGYAMPTQDALGDLPVVELPAAEKPAALALILSGDGGWRDIDKQIGQVLAKGDIGVVGLDTLRYFWSAKTPEQVAADLEKIIDHYQAAWQVEDVLLVGYSYGADVLPAAVDRMDQRHEHEVVQISLLGLAEEVAFEFHVAGNWLGLGIADTRPIAPDARRLDPAKLQCVYGEEEENSLCRAPFFQNAELIETTGGHHFDGDYHALARRIIDGYQRRRQA